MSRRVSQLPKQDPGLMAPEDLEVLIAEVLKTYQDPQGGPIPTGAVSYELDDMGGYLELGTISCKPKRRGYGTAFIKALFELGDLLGKDIRVFDIRPEAVGFWAKFKELDIREEDHTTDGWYYHR